MPTLDGLRVSNLWDIKANLLIRIVREKKAFASQVLNTVHVRCERIYTTHATLASSPAVQLVTSMAIQARSPHRKSTSSIVQTGTDPTQLDAHKHIDSYSWNVTDTTPLPGAFASIVNNLSRRSNR